ncbi:DUF3299 domain-containing protein [Thalassotalea sp. ND16A]|uniref:DUF3299 domain-containing protein n=1 Tax=Thalassotalea sp. ND16A TaxID=1535422 RepID=UPI00051A38CC|nr:DUF3299 domain-containing protein [Thalassotalea sp. ND16A]KGJ89489.1 hypothetical protein ND16A_2382 [Thalassotalea sp. ND16A]
MKKLVALFSLTSILLVSAFWSASSYAKVVKKISWETLNEHVQTVEIANPFESMNIDQIRRLQQVAIINDIVASGQPLDAESEKLGAQARKELEADGINIEELFKVREQIISQRKQEFQSTNPLLDNASIEMSGFLLPLEFEGKKVKEFLLVPYVGACIHEPPPAANQIVYAKLATPVAPPSLNMFTAVTVKGVMTSKLDAPELNLVDGAKEIPTSYTLNVDGIEFIDTTEH